MKSWCCLLLMVSLGSFCLLMCCCKGIMILLYFAFGMPFHHGTDWNNDVLSHSCLKNNKLVSHTSSTTTTTGWIWSTVCQRTIIWKGDLFQWGMRINYNKICAKVSWCLWREGKGKKKANKKIDRKRPKKTKVRNFGGEEKMIFRPVWDV